MAMMEYPIILSQNPNLENVYFSFVIVILA